MEAEATGVVAMEEAGWVAVVTEVAVTVAEGREVEKAGVAKVEVETVAEERVEGEKVGAGTVAATGEEARVEATEVVMAVEATVEEAMEEAD